MAAPNNGVVVKATTTTWPTGTDRDYPQFDVVPSTGRLIYFVHNGVSGNHGWFMYSDNDGATWQEATHDNTALTTVSSVTEQWGTETFMAVDADGYIHVWWMGGNGSWLGRFYTRGSISAGGLITWEAETNFATWDNTINALWGMSVVKLPNGNTNVIFAYGSGDSTTTLYLRVMKISSGVRSLVGSRISSFTGEVPYWVGLAPETTNDGKTVASNTYSFWVSSCKNSTITSARLQKYTGTGLETWSSGPEREMRQASDTLKNYNMIWDGERILFAYYTETNTKRFVLLERDSADTTTTNRGSSETQPDPVAVSKPTRLSFNKDTKDVYITSWIRETTPSLHGEAYTVWWRRADTTWQGGTRWDDDIIMAHNPLQVLPFCDYYKLGLTVAWREQPAGFAAFYYQPIVFRVRGGGWGMIPI